MSDYILKLKELLINEKIENFEEELRNLILKGDSSVIKDLLLLLDDDYHFHEVLFLIIHGVESFSIKEYSKGLISSFVFLIEQSPEWSETLAMRNMNSDDYFKELLININSLNKDDRKKIALFMKEIIIDNNKHLDKIHFFEEILN